MSLSEAGNLSLRQMRAMLAAIDTQKRRDDQRLLFLLRASRASDKGFKKAWEALSE